MYKYIGSKVFLCGGFNGGTVYYGACNVLGKEHHQLFKE